MTKNYETKDLADNAIRTLPMTDDLGDLIDDLKDSPIQTLINKISGCARGAESYAHQLNQVLDDTDPTISLSREDIDHLEEIDGCMAVLNHTLNDIYQGEHDRRAEARKAKIAERVEQIEDLKTELRELEEEI